MTEWFYMYFLKKKNLVCPALPMYFNYIIYKGLHQSNIN